MSRGEAGADFLLRRASPEDAEGILECLAAAFEPYRESYTLGGFADTVQAPNTLPRRLAGMSVFVAAGGRGGRDGRMRGDGRRGARPRDGRAPGLAGTRRRAAAPPRGGRRAAGEGLSARDLETTAPLARAIRFYEINGYSATGRISDFFGMPLFEYAKPLRIDDA